jgi:LEA14-like dessication related protein
MPFHLPACFARALRFLLAAGLLALGLSGCASLAGQDPLRFGIVGVDAAPGEGLELRFIVKLRVQNPNPEAVPYDGMALDLDVNGRTLATGVANVQGTVPRYGEQLFNVPVTISAFSAVRQALGLSELSQAESLPFVLRGKLGAGPFGATRFIDEGKLDLGAALRSSPDAAPNGRPGSGGAKR